MKNLLKFLWLIVLVNLSLTGCYTIIWDPTEDVAPSGDYDEESEFYEPGYFGGYGGFYESPWWVSNPVFIINTGSSDLPKTKERTNERDNGTGNFRNDGGRGNNDRRNPGSNDGNSGNIINTPPPTRDSGSNNTSNSGSYNSNNNSSTSSGNETRSSGTTNTRNNSGTRNSGNGRR